MSSGIQILRRTDDVARLLAVPAGWTAGLGVLALAGLSATQRLDQSLRAAHLPGNFAGGIGQIASPARLGSAHQAVQIGQGWKAYQEAGVPGARSVEWLTLAYLFADLALMLSLTAVLLLWWARLLRIGLSQGAADSVRWSCLPAVGYLVADLWETLAATGYWQGLTDTGATVIASVSLAKWVCLGLALLPLLLAEHRYGTFAAQQALLKPLRGQVAVALLLVVVFLALSGELGLQVDDVLIRAAEDGSTALWAGIASAVCGLSLVWGGRARIRAYADAPPPSSIGRWWLAAYGVAGAAAVCLGTWLPGRHVDVRWAGTWHAVAVAGGLLLAFTATSWPKSVREPDGSTGPASPVPVPEPTPTPEATPEPEPAPAPSNRWLVLLAGLPTIVLLLAVTRAATAQAASGEGHGVALTWRLVHPGHWPIAVRLVFWAVNLALLTAVLMIHANRRPVDLGGGTGSRARSLLGVLGVVGCWVLAAWAAGRPGPVADLGSGAVVFLFVTLLGLTLTALVSLGDQLPARGSLAVLGLRRLPLTGICLVLTLGASVADREGVYYDALTAADQRVGAGPADRALLSPGRMFIGWRDRHAAAAPGSTPSVSLVFVAAAGGGIKAAYWTAAAWSCALGAQCHGRTQPDHTGEVLLASGVSGGSLGLAAVKGNQEVPAVGEEKGSPWFDQALTGDFVAPSVAAFLFRDLPNSALRLPQPQDSRASALQDAWERRMPALRRPFFRRQAEVPDAFPYLALNGTGVEDGCRLSVSRVRMSPAPADVTRPGLCAGDSAAPGANGPLAFPVRDAVDYLCTRVRENTRVGAGRFPSNIRLSTAALLSARFPYVSPSGDLSRCGDHPVEKTADGAGTRVYSTEHTYVVDGGLFDNSGATAVEQVWQEISGQVGEWNREVGTGSGRPCLVPRLLVLDNHYDPQAAIPNAQRPQQLTAPPAAQGRVYDLRSVLPLARAERAIRDGAADAWRTCRRQERSTDQLAKDDPSVVVLHPVQRPGSQAPLGWTLSAWSRADMTSQLGTPLNECGIAVVRAWFTAEGATPRQTANGCPAEPADREALLRGLIRTEAHAAE